MSDDDTIRVYDEKAQDYARMVDTLKDPALDEFMAALPPGARVLDLGCGPGNAADVMARAGFSVLAVDASAEMVRLAARVEGIETRQARFDEIDEVDAYDGIWASFSLLHAPRAAFPGHLAALKRALRPGGLLFLGLKLGDGEKVDKIGRFYSYYREDELKALLRDAGFTLSSARTMTVTGMTGAPEDAIAVLAHG
ncbi:class I SAM-dependent methyltransferase [Marinibacterium profundimaris]|uniref:SAM-dependent methlyltransferase n=1 Tax=Marinibacterium profundimaris TaxID=1679460 RepID=A0A225NFD0_9RHOB|nr:class I SAM-dependent methyltransferase [Marinibacterium profundimaris]OWU71717.1 SAM-dependent methlyltransferase [Marinibacterium profundimaris]